ncbi:MAG: putative metal-binding motif-containing protein [Archangium sp.]|nr:putative metal-binding motif-containing protein [Archangium sp.]
MTINACSPPMPAGPCTSDAQCKTGEVCRDGACAAPLMMMGECNTGDTRACGNEAIGACRKGTQRCVNGAFETTCTGEVRPVAESCNSLDDDCDGQTDEGVTAAFFPDVDGDGFGAANGAATMACEKPTGFSDNADDCDDRAGAGAAIHPGATEQCDTAGVDENCNGTANEGCSCTNIGGMTPCCSGRGSQTCQAIDGGAQLSMCSAMSSAELCNNIDDDCDGQVDDQPQFTFDGGMGCTVGIGACQRAGVPVCMNGFASCTGAGGTPSVELCNGLDDDCNGATDDMAFLTEADGGAQLDGGTAFPDGTCSVGIGGCARTGNTLCSAAALVCTAQEGAPNAEACNSIDDDCDGTVDENDPGICSVTGQTCMNGSCACPSGQSVCNNACVTLSAEVCDGQDNDCDGQIDETLRIACVPDADNDLYADSATTSQQCPDNTRTAAGRCPAGFVAPASSFGTDCNPTVGSLYRLVASRSDSDNDTVCTGSTSNDCVGATALPGRRFVTDCNTAWAADDCNDSNVSVYRLMSSRADGDGDTFCFGTPTNDCVGLLPLPGRRFANTCNTVSDDCNDASSSLSLLTSSRNDLDGDGACSGAASLDCTGTTPLPGRRFASSCPATDDCNDTNAALFRMMLTRADADGDTYCTGAQVNECSGTNANFGRRFDAACQTPDDCNDGNSGVFRIASVRADADGDMYCAGGASNQCIGSSPPAGLRIVTSCLGDDCRDTNNQATTSCFLVNQYVTNSHVQTCPQGATNFLLVPSQLCPPGFTLTQVRPQILSGAGFCSAVDATTITQTCNFLEGSNCRIVGDCSAN